MPKPISETTPEAVAETPATGETTPTPAAKPKAKASPKKAPAPERPVVYPEPTVQLCVGNDVMTVDMAKNLLGWEVETPDVKFGDDYLTKDLAGNKVRMTNNTHNRPIQDTWVETLAQEHLRRRWRLNGETIVVGKRAEILSGQHRLASLILADERRVAEPDLWAKDWPEAVTMECVVIFGIDEADDVVNTLDTGKSRTLSDVLYRSELFAKYKPAKRRVMATAADHAVRMLWHRTGAKYDAFAPTRTHSEALDFIARHPKLLACIDHITSEESNGSVSNLLSLGYMSALTYLMTTCKSDYEKYRHDRREAKTDRSQFDPACEYVVALSGGSNDVGPVRKAIADLVDGGTVAEKVAIIVKGWNAFVEAKRVTPSQVKLEYRETDDGLRLDECPAVGGIDLGDPDQFHDDEEDASAEANKESVEAEKAKVKAEKDAKAKGDDATAESGNDELELIRRDHPDHVILFESEKNFAAFGRDADLINKHVGAKFAPNVNGLKCVRFAKNQIVPVHQSLNEAGYEIATATKTDGAVKVARQKPIAKKKPAGKK